MPRASEGTHKVKWDKTFVKEKVVNDLERLSKQATQLFNSQAVLIALLLSRSEWEVFIVLFLLHQKRTNKTLVNYNNNSLLSIFVCIFKCLHVFLCKLSARRERC